MMMRPAAAAAASGALLAVAGLHAAWGAGRAWPFRDRAVLAGRGALGLAGRTALVAPGSVSARFTRLDRRVYSPACLALAGLAAVSAWPGGGQGRIAGRPQRAARPGSR
jgi:hypothetical protein